MKKSGVIFILVLVLLSGFAICHAKEKSPAEVYDSYLAAIKTADKLDDLYPYITNRKMEALKAIPVKDKQRSLQFKKNIANSTSRKDIKSEINGNKAKLTINAVDTSSRKDVLVTVLLVMENNGWKVDRESFDFTKSE